MASLRLRTERLIIDSWILSSRIDFAAFADSSTSAILIRTEVVATVAAAAFKRQHSFVAPADPVVIEKKIVILRHARKFVGAVHPLNEKTERDFKAPRLAMLPSLVNVNAPRIAIHRRLDFIHNVSLILSYTVFS